MTTSSDIIVRVTDQKGLFHVRRFTIQLVDTNDVPYVSTGLRCWDKCPAEICSLSKSFRNEWGRDCIALSYDQVIKIVPTKQKLADDFWYVCMRSVSLYRIKACSWNVSRLSLLFNFSFLWRTSTRLGRLKSTKTPTMPSSPRLLQQTRIRVTYTPTHWSRTRAKSFSCSAHD